MKPIMLILGCLLAFSALADDAPYEPPVELTPAEVTTAETDLVNNHVKVTNEWKSRLAKAKQSKLIKPKPKTAKSLLTEEVDTTTAHQH